MSSKITVVVGPPCAGKSTYVQQNKKSGDVFIDADLMAQSMGAPTRHAHSGAHRNLVLRARQEAIYAILDGIDADAWIIHTNPSPMLVERYIEAGATFEVLDPGKEECLSRAKKDDRPEHTAEVIERWYASPPDLTPRKRVKGVVYLRG